MRFLVDMPLSPDLAQWLRAQGDEAVHAGDLGLERAPDTQLVARARADGCAIVTADLDFPRLLALTHATGPPVILFRGGNYSEQETTDLLAQVLDAYPEADIAGSIIVVGRQRMRRTRLPIGPQ
jgi:predicted nuclease of predicted toxin-antitoxin system